MNQHLHHLFQYTLVMMAFLSLKPTNSNANGYIFQTSSFCRESLFEGLHSGWEAVCATVIVPYVMTDLMYLPLDITPGLYDYNIDQEYGNQLKAGAGPSESTNASSQAAEPKINYKEKKLKLSLFQTLATDAYAVQAGYSPQHPVFIGLVQEVQSGKSLDEQAATLWVAKRVLEINSQFTQDRLKLEEEMENNQ